MEKKEENKKKDIRLASTVIICRSLPDHLIDNDQFNYEILLLKRRKEARFMPNYYVFPGGLVETTDYLPITSSLFPPLSEELKNDERKRAIRVGGIREVFEESNIFLSHPSSPSPSSLDLSQWKPAVLQSPAEFINMCEKLDSKIAINDMREWAHWITPEFEKYRYDTYFFLTTISYHSSISVAHDQKEIVAYEWIKPNVAMDRYLKGELKLAPPTWITIFELYQHRNISSLLHLASAGRNMSAILPVIGVASDLGMETDTNNNNNNNNNNNINITKKEENNNKIYLYLPGDEKSNNPLGKDVKNRILIDNSTPAPQYTLITTVPNPRSNL